MKTAEVWVKDLNFCCTDQEEANVIRAIQADAAAYKDNEIERLKLLHHTAVVANDDLAKRIAQLEGIAKGLEDLTIKKDQRIRELTALLDEAMKTTGLYINVPEFDRLKSIWTDYNKNLSS